MWEVQGWGPGVEAAEPEVVPTLAEGVPELQAGADAVLVVAADLLLPDRLPRVIREHPMVVGGRDEVISLSIGVPLGGRHLGVVSAEVDHEDKRYSGLPCLCWCSCLMFFD